MSSVDSSNAKQLIGINLIQNTSLCLHNVCVCTVYIYYVYIINTNTYSIYLENIYMYLHVYVYIHINYIIYKIYLIYINITYFSEICTRMCAFIYA